MIYAKKGKRIRANKKSNDILSDEKYLMIINISKIVNGKLFDKAKKSFFLSSLLKGRIKSK